MGSVQIAYLVFAALGVASFAWLRPAVAVLVCVLGGWALLPVGVYPPFWPGQEGTEFPYWIIGIALPSDMLLTKAWVGPVVAVVGVLAWDFGRVRRFRWGWVDLIPAVWCLSPLGPALVGRVSDPAAWVGVIYLTGSWGLTWWLGRMYFSDAPGRALLARALVLAGLVYVPICALEGVLQPSVYRWAYGLHPYEREGIARYLGFRPLGFLEHGNQLGMWMAGSALVAAWLAVRGVGGRPMRAAAAVLVLASLATQSVGAVILLGAGLGVLAAGRWVPVRWLLVGAVGVGVLGFGLYASGVVPFRKIAETTPLGRQALDLLRSTGRWSFGYRIAQDEKHLQTAYATGLLGSGRWDWWRETPSRPWGHWLLVVGQLGAVGLAAYVALWGWPVGRALWFPSGTGERSEGEAAVVSGLAMLLAITLADAFLNSFPVLPLLLAAGGLAAGGGASGTRAGPPVRPAISGPDGVRPATAAGASPRVGPHGPTLTSCVD